MPGASREKFCVVLKQFCIVIIYSSQWLSIALDPSGIAAHYLAGWMIQKGVLFLEEQWGLLGELSFEAVQCVAVCNCVFLLVLAPMWMWVRRVWPAAAAVAGPAVCILDA